MTSSRFAESSSSQINHPGQLNIKTYPTKIQKAPKVPWDSCWSAEGWWTKTRGRYPVVTILPPLRKSNQYYIVAVSIPYQAEICCIKQPCFGPEEKAFAAPLLKGMESTTIVEANRKQVVCCVIRYFSICFYEL